MASPNRDSEQPFRFPRARTVAPGTPWTWLRRGRDDLRGAPAASLFYGAAFAAMGWLLRRAARPGFAALVFATSAVSIPMLPDREKMDAVAPEQ